MSDRWKCPCGQTATIRDAQQYPEMGIPMCTDCDREMDRDYSAEGIQEFGYDAAGVQEVDEADQLAHDIVSGWNLDALIDYAANHLSSEFLENPDFFEASKHEYGGI